jgi:hypothetical protein
MTFAPPIVIELGEAHGTHLEELLQGTGALAEELEQVMRLVRDRAPQDTSNKILISVVAVYTNAGHRDTEVEAVANF